MSAKVYYGTIAATSWSAGSAAANYPASNAGLPAVQRTWRSANLTTQTLDQAYTLQTLRAIFVTAMNVDATGVIAYRDAANVSQNLAGSTTTTTDPIGRTKLLWTGGLPVSAQMSRVQFVSPAQAGAAYFEVGAMYSFGNVLTLPSDPLVGARIRYARPRVQNDLPNGQLADARTGPAYAEVTLRFRGLRSADLQQVERLAQAGVVVLDMGDPLAPWNVWAVRCQMKTVDRTLARATQDDVELVFREVVA